MTSRQSMFLFITGLLITFGAVGGIEASADDQGLLSGLLLSGVGLMIMWVSVLAQNTASYYDRG